MRGAHNVVQCVYGWSYARYVQHAAMQATHKYAVSAQKRFEGKCTAVWCLTTKKMILAHTAKPNTAEAINSKAFSQTMASHANHKKKIEVRSMTRLMCRSSPLVPCRKPRRGDTHIAANTPQPLPIMGRSKNCLECSGLPRPFAG